jgi:opacity protein-like surface antigen
MKKLFLAIVITGTSFAASTQIAQGNIIVDTYYGFTNAGQSLYETNWEFEADYWGTTATTSGFGAIGVRGEYLVSDKFGVGMDFAFDQGSASLSRSFDNDGDGVEEMYTTEGKTSKWGAMLTLNYHFVANQYIDLYVMGGAGYKSRTSTLTTDEPMGAEDFDDQAIGLTPETTIPFAGRVGLGCRFFFTENIGANVGVGLGQGGLMNAGLSFKF